MAQWNLSELRWGGVSAHGTKYALSPMQLKAQDPAENRRSERDVQSALSRRLLAPSDGPPQR
jgi:hypothetical protein